MSRKLHTTLKKAEVQIADATAWTVYCASQQLPIPRLLAYIVCLCFPYSMRNLLHLHLVRQEVNLLLSTESSHSIGQVNVSWQIWSYGISSHCWEKRVCSHAGRLALEIVLTNQWKLCCIFLRTQTRDIIIFVDVILRLLQSQSLADICVAFVIGNNHRPTIRNIYRAATFAFAGSGATALLSGGWVPVIPRSFHYWQPDPRWRLLPWLGNPGNPAMSPHAARKRASVTLRTSVEKRREGVEDETT